MPVHELSNADIVALSIVGKGANRKQFFLRKAASGEALVELPGPERLVKAADWSCVYCIVAEPGWHEEAGIGSDNSIEDRWASEDEIRKAAHRFMANGALVNRMHESLDAYGALVENAVALADFDVDGATIKKGSWYVAITPNAEGREAIEKGEFTGVSIQGTAMRTLVEKAIDFAAAAGPLRHLIAHYRKYPKPFTQCVLDNTKRFGPRAKNICAGLKDIMRGTIRWRAQFQKAAPGEAAEDAHLQAMCEVWGKQGLTVEDAEHALSVLQEQVVEKAAPQWEESKHPRGKPGSSSGGKFVSSGSSGGGSSNSNRSSGLDPKRIRHVARRLQRLGYYSPGKAGPPTQMTPTLRAAITRYQREKGIDVTGRPTDRTAQATRNDRGADEWDHVNPATGSVDRWNDLGDERRLRLMREFRSKGGKLPADRRFAEDGSILTGEQIKKPKNRGGSSARGPSLNGVEKGLLRKIAERVGVASDELDELDSDEELLKAAEATLEESSAEVPNLESVEASEALSGRVEALEQKLDELPAAIAKAIKEDAEEKAPTLEDVTKTVGELNEAVAKVAGDVQKLGDGGTSQGDDPEGESVEKSSDKPWVGVI